MTSIGVSGLKVVTGMKALSGDSVPTHGPISYKRLFGPEDLIKDDTKRIVTIFYPFMAKLSKLKRFLFTTVPPAREDKG